MPYLLLDTEEKKKALEKLYTDLLKQNKYFFYHLFYSGDYDTHDLLQARKPVPSGLDMLLLKDLQTALLEGRKSQLTAKYSMRNLDKDEIQDNYQRVQHGPQYNYIAQMINDNATIENPADINLIVDKVAAPDYPVLLLHNGNWKIIKEESELSQVYQNIGVNIKETWSDPQAKERFQKLVLEKAVVCALKQNVSEVETEIDTNNLAKTLKEFEKVYGSCLAAKIIVILTNMASEKRYVTQDKAVFYCKPKSQFGKIN